MTRESVVTPRSHLSSRGPPRDLAFSSGRPRPLRRGGSVTRPSSGQPTSVSPRLWRALAGRGGVPDPPVFLFSSSPPSLNAHYSQLTPSPAPFVVSRAGVPGKPALNLSKGPCRTTPHRMRQPIPSSPPLTSLPSPLYPSSPRHPAVRVLVLRTGRFLTGLFRAPNQQTAPNVPGEPLEPHPFHPARPNAPNLFIPIPIPVPISLLYPRHSPLPHRILAP